VQGVIWKAFINPIDEQGSLSKNLRSNMCDEAPDLIIVKSGKCSDIYEQCGHHIHHITE
jgi:hypothetical protein